MRTLSLCACCRHYPGAAAGRSLRSSHPAVSAFPERVVGSACTSSFSRLARRSLALRPAHSRRHLYVTCYTEGFSHIVTSMTAPVASGWSGCRVGLAPTGKRRLLTAHTRCSHSSPRAGRRELIARRSFRVRLFRLVWPAMSLASVAARARLRRLAARRQSTQFSHWPALAYTSASGALTKLSGWQGWARSRRSPHRDRCCSPCSPGL